MALETRQGAELVATSAPPNADLIAGTPQLSPRRARARSRSRLANAVRLVLLVFFSLVFLYPFAWLLAATFKPRGEVFDNRLWPKTFTPENYALVWEKLPLLDWIGNSVFIALASATLVTLSSSLVAYGFAMFRFPFRNAIFALVLGSMMLPGAVTMIPTYLIWQKLGFLGTTVPLWGTALFGSAFYIFLQRQFFLGLPREIFEAARVDGCGYLGQFFRIAFPLSIPSFIIVFIFEFQASWNNLQAPLIYLNLGTPEQFTVPLGISYAMTQYSPTAGGQGDYQWVMTAALIVTLPMLLLFAYGQKYFIEGATAGSIKG
ncbi:MAG TPA: carbohydrate ABC transporter permease [Propionibacteriaceae bacterium]